MNAEQTAYRLRFEEIYKHASELIGGVQALLLWGATAPNAKPDDPPDFSAERLDRFQKLVDTLDQF